MTNKGMDEAADLRPQVLEALPRLRRFCQALTRAQDAGDDLCQATVERVLSRAEQFIPGTRMDSWMYRIAQNMHIDAARRQKTRGREVDVDEAYGLSGEDGRAVVEGRSDLDRARSAMAALPQEQRLLLNLVVLDGMSYKDAAETLAIPIGTVMSRIARARRALDRAINGTPDQ